MNKKLRKLISKFDDHFTLEATKTIAGLEIRYARENSPKGNRYIYSIPALTLIISCNFANSDIHVSGRIDDIKTLINKFK